MKHLILLVINGVSERWGRCRRELCLCLLIVLFAAGCVKKDVIVYRPTQQDVSKISYSEAKNTIRQLWMAKGNKANTHKVKSNKNVIVLIAIDSANDKDIYVWDLTTMTDPYVTSDCWVKTDLGFSHTSYIKGTLYRYDYGFNRLRTLSETTAFANALYVLKHGAGAAELAAEAEFADKARKYREMPVKPPLPENVKRCRIMAEDAINNKEFEKAVDYYEQGLEIELLWPEGQFNAALLYGELKDYENAAIHMKRYLELVPNARDAREAREKVYLWEGKAKEAETK
jgi:tetratricopeptide (TPR) repeat protein